MKLLGSAEGTIEGAPFNLHSRKTWGVLGALLVSPRPLNRELLQSRFFGSFSNEAAKKGLTQALTSLRKELECVNQRDSIVELVGRERFSTDIDEMTLCLMQGQGETEANKRMEIFQRACRLYRGAFLADVDAEEDPEGWIYLQRELMMARASEAFHRYALALEQQKDYWGAFDVAHEAITLQEQHEEAIKLLFRLGDLSGRKYEAEIVHRYHSFDESLRRIRLHERKHEELTLRESVHFDQALESQLAKMAYPLRSSLFRLTVFAGSFTVQQAEAVANTHIDLLTKLKLSGFLLEEGNRWSLGTIVRERLWHLMPPERQEKLLDGFTAYFLNWLLEQASLYAKHPESALANEIQSSALNVQLAVDYSAKHWPKFPSFLQLGDLVGAMGTRMPTKAKETIRDKCQAIFENNGSSPQVKGNAAIVLGVSLTSLLEFTDAKSWLETGLDFPHSWPPCKVFSAISFVSHHGQMPDEAVIWNQKAIDIARQSRNSVELAKALNFRVELLRTRSNFAEATEAGNEALAILNKIDAHPLQIAECHYQLSHVCGKTVDQEENRHHVYQALLIRIRLHEQHGIADCLRRLSVIKLEQGLPIEALAFLDEATRIYASSGNPGSQAAATGQMGDAYMALGDRSTANHHYETALKFWRENGHPWWINHVESRLRTVQNSLSVHETKNVN